MGNQKKRGSTSRQSKATAKPDRSQREGSSSLPGERNESQPTSSASSTRKQGLLLILALGLLLGAFALNYRRFIAKPTVLPLPMPSEIMSSTPLAPTPPLPQGGPRFTHLTPAETGITPIHRVALEHPLAYLYYSGMASGGIAVGDIDQDGRLDLYVVSGPDRNRLYRQTSEPFHFEEITDQAGVDGGDAWGNGATMVDVNGDGRLDIYCANYDSPNQLYINQGQGKFVERATESGINISDASMQGTFADYDRDGDLDLYLLTYRYENPSGMPMDDPIVREGRQPVIQPDLARYYGITNDEIGYGVIGRSDGLLRNNGDGTFADVSERAGIHGLGHGQSATWWDFNDDGFPDLFVGNDFKDADQLYRNNGDGTFTDVIREAFPHTTWFSMGSDAGDLDGDGRFDLLTTDMSSTTHFKQKTSMGSMSGNSEFLQKAIPRQYMRNALLLNTGSPRFAEAAYLTGLDSTDWTWSVHMSDLDCDGRQDVYFTNGTIRSFADSDRTLTLSQRRGKTEWEIYKDTPPVREKNLSFRNQGDLLFEDVSSSWGLDHEGVSMASAQGDLDGDGDLDLIVVNLDEPLAIYRNESSEYQRLVVRLAGQAPNRFGIGARVTIRIGNQQQQRELFPNRGFLASNEPAVHFGLGDATLVDELIVHWPSGHIQSMTNIKGGQMLTITEPAGQAAEPKSVRPAIASLRPQGSPRFETRSLQGLPMHRENDFDDYGLQLLLPYKTSQLGPSLALADIDGDGNDDLFLSGSRGTPSQIAVQSRPGVYQLQPQPALEVDRNREVLGSMWLDVDGDLDLDLVSVGGGNEAPAGDASYGPRLYLNEGDGRLIAAPSGQLPELPISGGPLAAADYDRDGDVDLFVGGRQQPGQYPLGGTSLLLLNHEGSFTPIDGSQDPEFEASLKKLGMVTSALWTDVNQDHWLDLMVTNEWGLVELFFNREGKLQNQTASAGLHQYRGWWSSIAGADVDRDGDMDYVIGNLGLNTKYHADNEHPFRMFFGDFDRSGKPQLVEAEYENQTLFPVRGKSCSTAAMPFLADKFSTYREFAAASLQEIYTEECLDKSYQVTANQLSHALLLNDGSGHFQWNWLPRKTQLSPVFGLVVTELTGDGIPDLFLAQNFYAPQPETGNMDGGLGCLLIGQGDGTFQTCEAGDSGIVIPDDAKAAAVTDIDGDGRPDLIVATNNGPIRVAHQRADSSGSFLAVRLSHPGGTAALAGSRVRVWSGKENSSPSQLQEVHAGSGYLTQTGNWLFFGQKRERQSDQPSSLGLEPWQIEVTWPDGTRIVRQTSESKIVIAFPAARP